MRNQIAFREHGLDAYAITPPSTPTPPWPSSPAAPGAQAARVSALLLQLEGLLRAGDADSGM